MVQFSTDCRERGSHARGVYPTQDTSQGTARMKEEEEVDTIIKAKAEKEIWMKGTWAL